MYFFKSKGSREIPTSGAIELVEFSLKTGSVTSASDPTSNESFKRPVYHIPLILSQNPSVDDIANICINLGTPIKMHRFSGALSNFVWRVDLSNNKSVILRVYGESEDLIDRDIELYIL